MSDYIMPVRAIKNILQKEMQEHYARACQELYHDVQREFLHHAYHDIIVPKLESCNDYDSLDNFISEFYRMHLQEWIDSL